MSECVVREQIASFPFSLCLFLTLSTLSPLITSVACDGREKLYLRSCDIRIQINTGYFFRFYFQNYQGENACNLNTQDR